MNPDPVGSYHDAAGTRHDLLVRERRGGWQVLDQDTAAGRARVIDTLESPDDGTTVSHSLATVLKVVVASVAVGEKVIEAFGTFRTNGFPAALNWIVCASKRTVTGFDPSP